MIRPLAPVLSSLAAPAALTGLPWLVLLAAMYIGKRALDKRVSLSHRVFQFASGTCLLSRVRGRQLTNKIIIYMNNKEGLQPALFRLCCLPYFPPRMSLSKLEYVLRKWHVSINMIP
jgi:hypothetical protein